jgi:hypothetical protein
MMNQAAGGYSNLGSAQGNYEANQANAALQGAGVKNGVVGSLVGCGLQTATGITSDIIKSSGQGGAAAPPSNVGPKKDI